MKKQFIKIMVITVLCIFIVQSGVASAQTPVSNVSNVTFKQLDQEEFELIGPFDSITFSFALPADWEVKAGASMNLAMGVSFNTRTTDELYSVGLVSGTLSVFFNDQLVDTIPLGETGEIERVVQIPEEAFVSTRSDGRMEVLMDFDNRISCYGDYGGDLMSLYIHEKSYFTFPFESVQPDTSFTNFPRPLHQDSFTVDSALVVIPDDPTSAELQAAMTVAAGLSNLTGNDILMDLTRAGNLSNEQKSSSHLIYVGNAASLPVLGELAFPLQTSGGEFDYAESDPDDGIIQMINSPVSVPHVILAISGNTDAGTIKAAQALGSGSFFTILAPNLSIVQSVDLNSAVPTTSLEGKTLTELGFEGKVFSNRGVDVAPFPFYVPPGQTVAHDANFELVFGHSELIDYDRSGLSIVLNNAPIGSVRLTDETSKEAPNRVTVSIPASVIEPGINLLEVVASLEPVDFCTPPNLQGMWVNLWEESTFNVSFTANPVSTASNLDLASYPEPFISDPTLSNFAFVLPHNDLEAWRQSLQMASFLGANARGSLSALNVFYGDELPEAEREKYNLIVIGSPSQMPIIGEMNAALPVPFSADNESVPMDDKFQVTFRIPSDSPLGYIELLPSPWNANNVVMGILGNQGTGVYSAAQSITKPELRSKLAGNFAVINNEQIMSTDTRLSPSIVTDSAGDDGVVVVLPETDDTQPESEPPDWILPVLTVLVSLIVLIVVVAIIRKWIASRARR